MYRQILWMFGKLFILLSFNLFNGPDFVTFMSHC